MSQTKLTLQQKRSMADKCVSELEKKGIMHRIGKLITASHHLAKAAEYQPGERIAQLIVMPYPPCRIAEMNELSTSERGTDGYGSTGK